MFVYEAKIPVETVCFPVANTMVLKGYTFHCVEDEMETFGYKCAWFAVKSADPIAVATALQIADVHPCVWDKGISAVYTMNEGRVFITPPINGWVLCAGVDLFNLFTGEDYDRMIEFITTASAALQTEVQFFATHRVVEYHVWMNAQSGKQLRAYGYVGESGETLCNTGTPTTEEQTLGLVFPDESDAIDEEHIFPDEDDVLQLAGAWSINPGVLAEIPAGMGFLGRFTGKTSKPAYQTKAFIDNQSATLKKPWWKFW